ncbi:MAG: NIPSNAP family protein [Pseudomonadota bacterium]
MILEQRTYTIRTGMMRDFLDLVEQRGFPIAQRILGGPLGYFTEEVGDLNRVVHLWAYESMADRERRFAEIFAMPEWLAFIDAVLPAIERMETRLLRPAPFSPLTLEAVRALNRTA